MTRWVAVLVFVAGCGNITRKQDDAGVPKDGQIDAMIDAAVAPPDGPPDAPPPKESREVVNGGTAMSGTTYTLEAQVGHPLQQSEATGPTYRLEGNAAVKP